MKSPPIQVNLELGLLEAVLPEGEIGWNWMTISEIEEGYMQIIRTSNTVLTVVEECNHTLGVHGLAGVLQIEDDQN